MLENLAGAAPMPNFDQFPTQHEDRVANDGRHVHRTFFDDSANELSSIENSAVVAVVDAYGYPTGPNPYEQAKRQYLKKQNPQEN